MADVHVFPAHRRVGLIRRNAALLATYSPEGAARALAAMLRQQRAYLARIGADDALADDQIASLEAAIHAEVTRVSGGQRQWR